MPATTPTRREHIVTVTVHELECPGAKHGEDYTLKFKRGDTTSTFEPVTAYFGKIKCPSSWKSSAVVHFKSGGKGPNGYQAKVVSLELHHVVKGGAKASTKEIGTIQIDVTAALDDGKQIGARRQVKYVFKAANINAEAIVDLQVYPTGEQPPELPEEIGLPSPKKENASAATPEPPLSEVDQARATELEAEMATQTRLLAALEKARKVHEDYIKVVLVNRAQKAASETIASGRYEAQVNAAEITAEHRAAIAELDAARQALATAQEKQRVADSLRQNFIDEKMHVYTALHSQRDELIATRDRLNKEQRSRDVSEEAVSVMSEIDEVDARIGHEELRLAAEGIMPERKRLDVAAVEAANAVKEAETQVVAATDKIKACEGNERDLAKNAAAENLSAAAIAAKELTLYLAMCATPEGYADLKDAADARAAPPKVAAPAPVAQKKPEGIFDGLFASDKLDVTASESQGLSMTIGAQRSTAPAAPLPSALDLFANAVSAQPQLRFGGVANQSVASASSVSGGRSHGDDLFGSISSAGYSPQKAATATTSPAIDFRGARASPAPCPGDMDIFGAPPAPEAPSASNNVPLGRCATPPISVAAAPVAEPASVPTPARSPAGRGADLDFFAGVDEQQQRMQQVASKPKAVWADDASSLFAGGAVTPAARTAFSTNAASCSSEAASNWAPNQSLSVGEQSSQRLARVNANDNDLFADVVPVKHYAATFAPPPRAMTPTSSSPAPQGVDLFAAERMAGASTPPVRKAPVFDPFAGFGGASDVPDDQLFA